MATVCGKPTFSGMYTHIDIFLPTDYEVGMIYTQAYQSFKICSDWTRFHEELNLLKHVFLKLVSAVFIKFLFFHQITALEKL